MNEKPAILIVEDEEDIAQLMQTYLMREGYEVYVAEDGEKAMEELKRKTFQLVVLDLMLPKVNGFEVLQYIRQLGNTPVLIVSSKSEEVDKIVGLRLGADDYMTKPFGLGEFIARVQAMLRRFLDLNPTIEPDSSLLCHGDIRMNVQTYEVYVGQEEKMLTAKEFKLLKLFLQNPKRVFTKAQIFQHVWEQDYLFDENTVMVYIRRLRAKIEVQPSEPMYIQTVWGIGYKLGKAGESLSSS